MDVKARLQQLMDDRGWTIYRVAKEADIPWSTVRNMFKRNTEPSISTLECFCKGMGMTLPQFFDVDNDMGPRERRENYTAKSREIMVYYTGKQRIQGCRIKTATETRWFCLE